MDGTVSLYSIYRTWPVMSHRNDPEILNTMFSEVLKVSNALCHGQIGASADPAKGEAYIATELSGEKAIYRYSYLAETMRKIECIGSSLPRPFLTSVATHQP